MGINKNILYGTLATVGAILLIIISASSGSPTNSSVTPASPSDSIQTQNQVAPTVNNNVQKSQAVVKQPVITNQVAPKTNQTATVQATASWHTAFTYSDNTTINTTPFNMKGSQSRITYTCTTIDTNIGKGDFSGVIDSTGKSGDRNVFADMANCPITKTFNIYSMEPAQYYLQLLPVNASYSVTVEDYY